MIDLRDYVLTYTDGGCYSLGWCDRLPSGGHYWFEMAVWYGGQHR
jgi:hypothetical protein